MRKALLLVSVLVLYMQLYAQNWKQLHFNSIVADTHNDILTTAIEKGYSFDQNLKGKTHSDLHVGLGSDFDGITSTPQKINDVTDCPLITQELIRRGYTEQQIKNIRGGNFIRLLQTVEKAAQP